ncbi:MAG: LemA family protein, partial [bacterium]
AETEDRIAAGRRYYNANVRAINTRIEAFPSNIVAGAFHFKQEEYFEVDDPAVRANVGVDFGELGSRGGVGSVAPTPPPPAASFAPPGSALPPTALPPTAPPPTALPPSAQSGPLPPAPPPSA